MYSSPRLYYQGRSGPNSPIGPKNLTIHCRCCPHLMWCHIAGCLHCHKRHTSLLTSGGFYWNLEIFFEITFGDWVCCAKCFLIRLVSLDSKLQRLKANISCPFFRCSISMDLISARCQLICLLQSWSVRNVFSHRGHVISGRVCLPISPNVCFSEFSTTL